MEQHKIGDYDYRVMRMPARQGGNHEIAEVYYGPKGITGYKLAGDLAANIGVADTLEELQADVALMGEAFDKPVLVKSEVDAALGWGVPVS